MNTFCFIIALIFLMISLYFVKRRKLDFKCSFLWIALSLVFMFFSVNLGTVDYLAQKASVYYAPALLFLLGILFAFLLIFYVMIAVSDMYKKITRLSQEIAILKEFNDRSNV